MRWSHKMKMTSCNALSVLQKSIIDGLLKLKRRHVRRSLWPRKEWLCKYSGCRKLWAPKLLQEVALSFRHGRLKDTIYCRYETRIAIKWNKGTFTKTKPRKKRGSFLLLLLLRCNRAKKEERGSFLLLTLQWRVGAYEAMKLKTPRLQDDLGEDDNESTAEKEEFCVTRIGHNVSNT